MVSAVLLIGAPGSGKSSVLEELATLHDIHGIEHGARGQSTRRSGPYRSASAAVRALTARPMAAAARSSCSSSWAAETCRRTRAVPSGTTG